MSRQLFGLWIALLVGCVDERGPYCHRQSDCVRTMDGGDTAGRICTNRGRCEAECTRDEDCPRFAACVSSCGVCVTRSGVPATCFTTPLGTDIVIGACRGQSLDEARLRIPAGVEAPSQLTCPTDDRPLPYPDFSTANVEENAVSTDARDVQTDTRDAADADVRDAEYADARDAQNDASSAAKADVEDSHDAE